MTENQLFNLEKIKELTSSIDVLQEKVHQLNRNSEKLKAYTQSVIQNFSNDAYLSQIDETLKLMLTVNNNLEGVSRNNISIFLGLQESLIKKYKHQEFHVSNGWLNHKGYASEHFTFIGIMVLGLVFYVLLILAMKHQLYGD